MSTEQKVETYLLDSNVVIRAFQGHKAEAELVANLLDDKAIYFSPIVVSEFLVRATSIEKEELVRMIDESHLLLVDYETAVVAAEYRKRFSRKVRRAYLLDCLIAAQAKIHKLTLVTNNKSDFPMKDIKFISPK